MANTSDENNKNTDGNSAGPLENVADESLQDADISYESGADADLDDSVVTEETLQETVKKLREKLKKVSAEKQEYLTGWQKDKAEFLNARKRDKEANEQFIKFANENLINEFIPVLDSFNMAMGNKEAWDKVEKNWRVGVEYIFGQLKKVLEENGLKEVDPIGLKFDPMRDEAISFEPVDDPAKDQTVTTVIQKGYMLNGKALKAPKVKVGEFKK
ncbi:MAG: GrpE protein molecular chaperone GrpE [Candidatus Taylorbacteria bacterium]|nr:GrpE protein molecular chaperone GrpE [Candidatus Taylorbacteria bacterium]